MNALKRALISAAILLILTCGARPAHAASIPFINVNALGLELCPQSFCGAAIFVGLLHGQVGINPFALGTFAVGINHTDLPADGDPNPAFLTGGSFDFRFGLRRIRGGVVPGGVLFNNGDNTFLVLAELLTTENTLINAVVLLDHNTFPPTVRAAVQSQ